MSRSMAEIRGSVLINALAMILVVVVGILLSYQLLDTLGNEGFQSGSRFVSVFIALLAAPLGFLKADLNKLSEMEGLTVREKREVSIRVHGAFKRYIGCFLFLLLVVLYWAVLIFWPVDSRYFQYLAWVSGGLILLTLFMAYNVLENIFEIHSFIDRVYLRKQQRQRSNELKQALHRRDEEAM